MFFLGANKCLFSYEKQTIYFSILSSSRRERSTRTQHGCHETHTDLFNNACPYIHVRMVLRAHTITGIAGSHYNNKVSTCTSSMSFLCPQTLENIIFFILKTRCVIKLATISALFKRQKYDVSEGFLMDLKRVIVMWNRDAHDIFSLRAWLHYSQKQELALAK